jgi:predicted secreted hydrolase
MATLNRILAAAAAAAAIGVPAAATIGVPDAATNGVPGAVAIGVPATQAAVHKPQAAVRKPQAAVHETQAAVHTGDTNGWKIAEPNRTIVLPADHVSHPDYKIEWWYYTGNLDTREGRRFGYQLTFFRVGANRERTSESRWAIRDLHMAHFAVSDFADRRFHAFDRLQREGTGWVGASTDRYHVWNGRWSVQAEADGSHRLYARDTATGVAIDLHLTNTTRWVAHGRAGFSQKGREPANASEYYSLPRLTTKGTVAIEGRTYDVGGLSWMDHEFGSSMLEADQVGWDWLGVQLDDGRDIMLYHLRRRDGSRDPFSSGTIVLRDGEVVRLTLDDYTLEPRETWRSPTTGVVYPIRWHVTIPQQKIAFDVQAAMPNQELNTARTAGVTYWEGAVDVSGGVHGRGYLELTGYNGVPLSRALR